MPGRLVGRLAALGFAVVWAGCQSSPVLNSQYISPRVTGRLVDAVTGQPIRNVSVRRVIPGQPLAASPSRGGGESLERNPGIRTDANGAFDLDSERDLTIIRQAGWYSVTVAFARKGYDRLVTTHTLTNAVLTPSGEPLVNAGDLRIQPSSKQRQ